ncbi:hypothetical protein [Cognatishimia activa]|uniref:hypothetical protein n=1 Tax=Cognatishimia activa TaxID=1715691 RepID=UPI00071C331C|nr:hypothetical protein [Cognatishimia activa]
MRILKITAITCIAFGGLAACGDTTLEQGLLGAGAGAGAAVVTGGNTTAGAAIGAAANVAYCKTYPDRCN